MKLSPQSISNVIPVDSAREEYPLGFDDGVQMDLMTRQYNVQDVGDIRMFEHEDFIVDDDFISSREFDTFLY